MLETISDLNADTRRDPDLAQHVAYAEEPYRAGEERALQLSEAAAATAMREMGVMAGISARDKFRESQALHTGQQQPEGTLSGNNEPASVVRQLDQEQAKDVEAIEGREKIKQWLTEGLATVHTWIGDNSIDKQHNTEGSNRFLTLFSEFGRARTLLKEARSNMPLSHQKAFDTGGVSEVVTVSKLDKKFEKVRSDSVKGQEDVVMISYDTGISGGKGNPFLEMKLFLPESEAQEVLAAIEGNPQLAHEMVETFMTDVVHAGEAWNDYRRPNYDEMRAHNQGTMRLAMRDSRTVGPSDSKIIEY